MHLLQSDYDILALQEVYVAARDLRLPGYVGYSSATACTLPTCTAAPCLDGNHPQGPPRCAIYVRRELNHAEVNVADLTGGPMECCAVTVRLRGLDTTVASIYVRPCQRWDASTLRQLATRLGRNFLLCGDVNAHHTAWGSRSCCKRGRELVEVYRTTGMQVLNTGAFTYVRRGARTTCTAIDVSVATEGAHYSWSTQPDSWGSDHLPITITPAGGKRPRTRLCSTIDWGAFRRQLDGIGQDQDFFQGVADAAQAATICSRMAEDQPVPDLRHLNLRAARRRAERRALRTRLPEHRTEHNRIDAACRRHANRRRRQSWQGVCQSISKANGGPRA